MKLARLTGAAVSRSCGYHYSNTKLHVLHTGGVFQRRRCGCSKRHVQQLYRSGIFSVGSVLGSKRSNTNSVPRPKAPHHRLVCHTFQPSKSRIQTLTHISPSHHPPDQLQRYDQRPDQHAHQSSYGHQQLPQRRDR